jgi:hypothetical protein
VNPIDLDAIHRNNQTPLIIVAFLAGLGLLLVIISRLRRLAGHRLALLVANLLTVIAAALATMVSASGMWKCFTDILGPSPLRIVFFAYIEVALFASAFLARARLVREPAKGTTGVDGAAVWVLAAITASLSALDASSFREICLRLVAPLVAAWMWERALAAERSVRLGNTVAHIHWAVTIERILIWLRLAESSDRDVSEIDRARRRARLGRARLRLHLLQNKKAATWRIRRAHNRVIRQAMHAAEHVGLADFPDAADEREAIQMYMATLYGVIDATTPEAVAHFNAWRPNGRNAGHESPAHNLAQAATAEDGQVDPQPTAPAGVALPLRRMDGVLSDTEPLGKMTSSGILESAVSPAHEASEVKDEKAAGYHDIAVRPAEASHRGGRHDGPPISSRPYELQSGPAEVGDDQGSAAEDDRSSVAAMRRFWNTEIAEGRVPTGAELSRAAGVPPSTGLGRRKRREWEAELHDHIKGAVPAGR